MNPSGGERERRILIIDPDSLLAAGLVHLLESAAQTAGNRVVVARIAPGYCEEFVRTLEAYRPHLVIVPDLDFRFCGEAQRALHNCSPTPRVIQMSPDCNEAFVQDLSQVWLAGIHDLIALIPQD